MAVYNSPAVTAAKPFPANGTFGTVYSQIATVTCSAAPSTSDTLNFFTIPKNSVILGYKLMATQVDTNGSPTFSLNVGDAGSATRLFSAATVGRTATPTWVNETASTATYTGVNYQTTADTLIVGVPQANAATGAAGSVTLQVFYSPVGGAS